MENKDRIEYICLGSGSSGNAYIFRKADECVLVECGFEWRVLLDKLTQNNIRLSDIVSVVVSHRHSDHAKSIHNFIQLGISVFAPKSALTEEEMILPNVRVVEDNKAYRISTFLKMKAFSTIHDVESYGYIFLDMENSETTLFITDTKFFDFPFKNYSFDYLFIECNHIRKQLEVIMEKALDNHEGTKVYKLKRQSSYHLSLASLKKMLNTMNLTKTKGIFLIHFSKECGNPDLCKQEIRNVYNIKTLVCKNSGGIE